MGGYVAKEIKKGQRKDIMLRLSFEYNSRAFLNYIDKENKLAELESELAKKLV